MNVLIIGLGSIAQKHIQVLRVITEDKVNIYALRSDLRGYKPEHVTNISSVEEAGVKFDFAIISNPTFSHYKTLELLISYGFPVFIEKPLFDTLEGGEELIKKIRQRNIKSYIACNLRFHPCIRYLKGLIDKSEGKINEVNVYCGSYLPDWRPSIDYRKVYSANKKEGGGVHLDLIHELDYITWLLGVPSEVKSLLQRNSQLEIDTVDYANYILSYSRFTTSVILNYFRRDAKRTCEVLFEDRTIVVDIINQKVWSNGELVFSSKVDPLYTYIEQMKYFLETIQTDKPLMNNIEEAYKVLQICLKNG